MANQHNVCQGNPRQDPRQNQTQLNSSNQRLASFGSRGQNTREKVAERFGSNQSPGTSLVVTLCQVHSLPTIAVYPGAGAVQLAGLPEGECAAATLGLGGRGFPSSEACQLLGDWGSGTISKQASRHKACGPALKAFFWVRLHGYLLDLRKY